MYGLTAIVEDKKDGFWFGAGGVFRYNRKSFTSFTHNSKAFKNVRSVIDDKKVNIWIASGSNSYQGMNAFPVR